MKSWTSRFRARPLFPIQFVRTQSFDTRKNQKTQIEKNAGEFGSHADNAVEYHLACESLAHEFYFAGFTDMPERRIMGPRLLQEIELQFDGVDNLKTQLAHHVSGLFGQGWIWIVAYDGQLEILTTGPGDSFLVRPDSDKIVPIFALDAWEHAYITHFGDDVAAYVDAWWACLDMVQAEHALIPALQSAGLD